MERKRPLVGVGVIIIKNKKFLLLKRKNSHGDRTWCFPGGHLEFNESLNECAKREAMEEAGIRIKNVRPITFTNDIFKKENKHYITLFVIADYASGKIKNKEPEKSSEMNWFDWKNLPSPLFTPIKNLLKKDFNPFTS